MGLLEETVNQYLGITTNYYAVIDYTAFRDSVDAIGGIDFTVNSSDPRGIYDPSIDWTTKGPLVKLSNGVHHLNGEQALDLARARGDA
jgi:LCP family protein required for cell wall assembly